MTSSQRNMICQRMNSLGYSKSKVFSLLDTIIKWDKASGPEWTVNRLKSLKTYWLTKEAGLNQPPDWVALNSRGEPKGPFKHLFLDGMSIKQKGKAINMLMSYTTYVGNHPTASQWKKFQEAVENPNPTLNKPTARKFKHITAPRIANPRSVTVYPWSSSKRAPGLNTNHAETEVNAWYREALEQPYVRKMISRYPQHYQPVMAGVPHTILQQKPSFMKTMEEMRIGTVGRIGFIQEPGLKLRVVANPNRLTQLALEPLKHQTFALLRQISEDVTFDQEEGVRFAFDSIRSGKIVHSIDLSNATDTFPLEYQLEVGEAFGLDSEYLNHFRDVSIGQWDVFDPILNENRNISWTKGQPLGLGPSFPLFALAHHALVHEAAAAVDYDKNGPLYHGENRFEAFDKYRILGDDIIITDDDLAAKYLEKLREIGCPVSKDKTISSNKLCEFAGKIILPEGIIPTGKWREMSDRNFIDYVKFYGPQSISMLRPRQKLVVKAISELPDFLGGLGWNPHGKSIEKRVEENLHLINDDDETFHKVSNNTIPLQSLIDLGMYPTMEGLNKPPGFTAIAQTEANSQQDRPGPVEMNLTNKLSIQGIQLSLNILEDRVLDDISIASYLKRVVRESSDPRGKSTLEVWEGKLRSSQPDPSVLVDANPTTTKQPVRKVARRAVKGPKM